MSFPPNKHLYNHAAAMQAEGERRSTQILEALNGRLGQIAGSLGNAERKIDDNVLSVAFSNPFDKPAGRVVQVVLDNDNAKVTYHDHNTVDVAKSLKGERTVDLAERSPAEAAGLLYAAMEEVEPFQLRAARAATARRYEAAAVCGGPSSWS